MGLCNGNGTMLRRSAQILLVAENDHFEGSIDPNEAQGAEGGPGGEIADPRKMQKP